MSPLALVLSVSAAALAGVVVLAALRPRAIVEQPRVVLVLLGLVTLGALAAIVRLDPLGSRIILDPSGEPLIPASDPGKATYARAALQFGSDDLYVVAMTTQPDLFRADHLAALRRVTDAIERLPSVREVDSLTSTIEFHYDPEIGGPAVGPLIGRVLPSEPAALARLRDRVLQNPLYRKTLVSEDGRTAGINVGFQPMTNLEFVQSGIDEAIQAILAQEVAPGREFFITGPPHIRAEGHHLMVADLLLLIPLAVSVAAFSLFVMTGSLRGTLISLSTCLMATIWAFGAMGIAGVNMNLISLVLGPMLICVGSVYGVYSYERYELIAPDAPDRGSAALRTLEYIRLPMFVAAATTMIGFAVYLFADVPATNEFGLFAAFGIGAVWLIALTGVPSVLAVLPAAAFAAEGPAYASRTRIAARFGGAVSRALDGVSWLVGNHPGKVILVWLCALGLAVALLPRIVVDTDFLSFFPEHSPVRSHFAAVNRVLVGAVPIFVTVETAREGAFREPAALRQLDAIRRDVEALDGVDRVLSAVELIQQANASLDGGPAVIPATREGAAEGVFALPKASLRRFANANQSSANLIVRTDRIGSAAVHALELEIREILARHPIDGAAVDVTGNAVLINRSADGIARNQLAQIVAAAAAIMLLVGGALRSWRIGVVSIVPNVVPVTLFFGVLGLHVAPLSLATGLIGSMALGIAVDDTVHFLVGYRHARDEGLSPEQAAGATLQTSGRAIVLTSIMLVIGFSIVLLSNFAALRDFAALSAVTIGICLLSDLTLTPSLLVKVRY